MSESTWSEKRLAHWHGFMSAHDLYEIEWTPPEDLKEAEDQAWHEREKLAAQRGE